MSISTHAQHLNAIRLTMKNLLIAAGIFAVLLIGILFWLAGSVGPDTAPQDVRTLELPSNYDQ
jgi:low temperature requirement protein LtrA